jgi:hypothetical protein
MIRKKIRKIIENLKYEEYFFLAPILIFAGLIRVNNLFFYNQWWGDDGGAHLKYIEIIQNQWRLPNMNDIYIAWHEPLYYILMSIWGSLGNFIGFGGQDWMIALQILFSLLGLVFIWFLSKTIAGHKVSIATTILSSVIFVYVKMSSYLTNELITQVGFIGLIFWFIKQKLFQEEKSKQIFFWAVILGCLTLVKMTLFILFLSAILLWLVRFIYEKNLTFLKYIIICIFTVMLINTPWFIHKQKTFGSAFSVNLYEQKKQSLVTSPGWNNLLSVNTKIFTSEPYWKSSPVSFWSMLISDTFSDHYNLFKNREYQRNISPEEKKLVDNGRYSDFNLKQVVLISNQIGLLIFILWFIGFSGVLIKKVKNLFNKKIDWTFYFFVIIIFGGISALAYNTLRHPYYDRGVLKSQFIFFVFPLISILAFQWWKNQFGKIGLAIVFMPILCYIYFALPMLLVH